MTIRLIPLRLALALAVLFALDPDGLLAQPGDDIAFSGGLSLNVDTYGASSSPSGSAPSRRPSSLARLSFNPLISAGDFSMPLSFSFTIPESASRLPAGTGGGVADFLRNPGNTFSAVPSVGSARLYLGTQNPTLSKLSGGDLQLFGLGAETAVGVMKFTASAGFVGRPAAVDTALGVRGAYERHAYAGRLAYEEGGSVVGLSIVRVADAPSSLALPEHAPDEMLRLIPMAEESLTAALDAKIPIGSSIRIEAEADASLYTRDMRSQAIDGSIDVLPLQRLSTRADGAGRLEFVMVGDTWAVTLGSTYVGPGYRTLARQWLESDRLDLTLSPRVELFDEHLLLSGTFGWRRNNLAATEEVTTSQPLASVSADARIGESISLLAQYSNHGVRTPLRNDTLRVESVAQTLMIAPTLTLASQFVTHVLALTATMDDYTDYNPIDGHDASNRIRSGTGMYAVTFAEIPISADLSASWLVNQLGAGDLTITTTSLGASTRLLDGAITLGARSTLARSWLEDAAADESLTFRLTANWRVTNDVGLRIDGSTTGHAYARGADVRENLLRTSIDLRW